MTLDWTRGLGALLTLAALLAMPSAAMAAGEVEDRAQLERDLADARSRLDAAAQDVAEVTRKLYGDEPQEIIRFMHGTPGGAMLGINIATDEPRDEGVEVSGVSPGGPAEAAGLRSGDIIMSVDGKVLKRRDALAPAAQLVQYMSGVKPGQVVRVEFRRAGKLQTAGVTAAPAEPPLARILRERIGPLQEHIDIEGIQRMLLPAPVLGQLELVPVTPGLGRYFGTEEGLLVVRAPPGQASGLQEGDVLLSIGGRKPDNPGHAFRILRSYQPGEKVRLEVLRDRKRLNLDTTIPAADGTGFMGMPQLPGPPPPRQPPPPPQRESA
jgi:predicted metalloprotease with PDZ domain